jgi:hypothetical protein
MSMADRFYCTYCSEQHAPDTGTQLDARYALGRCGKVKRTLVRDQAEALRLAERGGKLRPKDIPLGGGQAPKQIRALSDAETRAAQGRR